MFHLEVNDNENLEEFLLYDCKRTENQFNFLSEKVI